MSDRPALRGDERDLPGLLDWGDELLEATVRAERVRTGGSRRRTRRWRARRGAIALLAAAGALLVPGAVVATRSIWDDPVGRTDVAKLASTPAVRLVEGRTGDVLWRIGGWNAGGGQVCLRTEAWRGAQRAMVASNCDTPRTGAKLTVSGVGAGDLTLVAGTAAPAVAKVAVRLASGDPVTVDTVAVPAENLQRSGLTNVSRLYVAVFPRGAGTATRPPAVTAYGGDGATLGTLGGAAR